MTHRQKIVVGAVLVVLALLYSAAAASAHGSGQGSASQKPGGIVGWLGHIVGKPPAAPRSDESAPCLSGQTLSVQGSCMLTVAKSSTRTRQVKLHANDAVTVTSRAPNGSQAITATVKAGADVTVTVDASGSDIEISCTTSGSNCVATLG
jgi:hypothetical protein